MKHWILFTLLILLSPVAHAHRMELDCFIENGELVIQAWVGRDAASDSEVTIASESGEILVTGTTNDSGMFRWKPEPWQNIQIQVYAGQGHKESLMISADELEEMLSEAESAAVLTEDSADRDAAKSIADTTKPVVAVPSSMQARSSVRSTGNTWGMPERIILGLTFIFALSAAYLTYANSKRLKELEDYIKNRES